MNVDNSGVLYRAKKKMNRYDYLIIVTIFSSIFAGETFGAFTPVKIIGFFFSFYFVVYFQQWRNLLLKKIKGITIFFSFMLLHSLVSIFWAGNMHEYLIAALTLYILTFIFLLIFCCSQRAAYPIRSIIIGWTVLLIANLSCAYYEVLSGNHFSAGSYQADVTSVDIEGNKIMRVYAAVTYGNYNSFALLLVLHLLFILLLIYLSKTFSAKFWGLVLFFSSCTILIINTSRGCLLSLMFFSIPLWYAIRHLGKIKYIVVVVLLGALAYLLVEYSEMITFLIERKFGGRDASDLSSEPRLILWSGSWRIICHWLFMGAGGGNMISEFEAHHIPQGYCHNLWLQMLLEYGIVPTLLFLGFYLKFVWKNLFSRDSIQIILGLYMVFVWPFLTIVDEAYLKTCHFMFFASIYGIYYHCRYH